MNYIYVGIICALVAIIGWLLYERRQKREREKPKNAEGFFAAIKKMIDGFRRIGSVITDFFNRFKYIGQGIAAGSKGVGVAIKNSAIMGGTLINDSFVVGYEGAKYSYKYIVCTLERIKVLHYCFIFYIFDFVIYMIHIIVMSVCVLLDAVFRIRSRLGYTLLSAYQDAIKSTNAIDKLIYSYFGVHVTTYPDYILNLCYKCVASRDALNRAEDTVYDDVNVRFPPMTREFIDLFKRSGERFSAAFAPL